jgi:hypothetical protein
VSLGVNGKPIGRPAKQATIKKQAADALAKLKSIVADTTLPTETRAQAAQALLKLQTPPAAPVGKRMVYIEQWNKYVCACDPFADDSERCADCNREWHAADAARRARENAPVTAPDDTIDMSAFEAELDALEAEVDAFEELGEVGAE